MLTKTRALFARLLDKGYFRALIGLDIALIVLFLLCYVLANRGILAGIPEPFQLARERSIPETLSYLKWIVSAAALGWCWLKTRQSSYAALAALLVLLAVDDALLFHETYGWVVAEKFNIPVAFAMDPKEIGEAIVFGLMGCFALILLGYAFWRADDAGRAVTLAILVTILGLAFTGVVLDAFHHMSSTIEAPRLRRLMILGLTLAEDGGETLLGSVMLSLCILRATDVMNRPASGPATDRIRP